MITIRKAAGSDLDAVASIYDELHREIGIVPTVFNSIRQEFPHPLQVVG